MSRRVPRVRSRHLAGLFPAAVLAGCWYALGEPGHQGSALALAAAALVCYPPAALSAPGFPGCLVTRGARAWHRAGRPRPPQVVPEWMRRLVLRVSLGQCAARRLGGCRGGIEVDHICPQAAGGLPWFWNLAGLCHRHNMVKSNYWRTRDGYEFYRPWSGYDNKPLAARILAAERRHIRLSPARYILAGLLAVAW